MLVVCSKLVKEVLASFNTEGIGVVRKVAILEHVVDVIPNIFERDSKFAVVVHYLFSLTPVLVSLHLESARVSRIIRV